MDIYIVILLFAAVSGFNIGLFYLVRGLKRGQKVFMPVGTIVFSICLLFSYYELEALFFEYPQYIWVNAPLLFCIGPLFYLQSKRTLRKSDILHFLPFIVMVIWLLPIYIKSPEEKLHIIEIFLSRTDKPRIEPMQYLYILHIGLYTLFGYLNTRNRLSAFSEYATNADKKYQFQKIQNLYFLIALLCFVSFIICFISDFIGLYNNGIDRFTMALLVILILFLQFYFTVKGYDEQLENEYGANKRGKSAKSQDNPNERRYVKLMERLTDVMQTEKLYRNPDLKINDVAKYLNVSMHELSACINLHNGNNFFDYINKLRIEELKTTLLDEKNSHLTLFAIARESGFKSNSSFYRVFKKYMDQTPKQYITRHHHSVSS